MGKRKVPDILKQLRDNLKRKEAGKPLVKVDKVECYSCGCSLLIGESIPLCGLHKGKKYYRCSKCAVGSRRWKKFNQESEHYIKYYKKSDEDKEE